MIKLYFNISLLIINFSLTLALGFNSTMAFESAESAKCFYAQEKPPVKKEKKPQEKPPPVKKVKKKKEPRRRGECDHLPSVWTINICETSVFCYQKPEKVRLWLPKHKRSGQTNDRLLIQNQTTQMAVIEQWAATEVTFAWPLSNMPLHSGATYWVGVKKKGRDFSMIELTLYQIPANISKIEQIAKMRQQSCSQQADMLEKIGM